MTTFKMVVSTVADRNGLYADFSPMPLSDKPGNGYHINIFAKNKDGVDMVKYAAAGILDKIKDITIFLNPTDSSYHRFGTSTAPNKVNWSSTGGSELISICEDFGRTKVELRSPDALSNPYLVYALLIYAGLYGIQNKMELPEEMDESSIMLPKSRKEAMRFAEVSDFIHDILPKNVIDKYI
jgi:glutamine synthetase